MVLDCDQTGRSQSPGDAKYIRSMAAPKDVRRKRVVIVGAGAAGMSCAATLAQHPDKFDVTVIEKGPVCGGQATSIPLDEKRFGASWMNNGVQGGSPVRPRRGTSIFCGSARAYTAVRSSSTPSTSSANTATTQRRCSSKSPLARENPASGRTSSPVSSWSSTLRTSGNSASF